MNISQFLSPEHSQCDIAGVSKKRILEYLSGFLNDDGCEADADDIYQKLLERERLGSTGIGDGVAIPHCRSANCHKITGALLKLNDSVDFDSLDGKPVDLVFALVVPEEQNQDHLDALAAIARLLQSDEVRSRLRSATCDADLYRLAISQQEPMAS
jgi:nitrogen PTS system EIIA component